MNTNYTNSNSNFANRRNAPRFRKQFLVGMEDAHQNFCQSHTVNVSATGLRLVVKHAVNRGQSFRLTLCLDENNLVEFDGTAVWQERLGSMGTHVIGVAFEPGQTAPTSALIQWLETQAA